jgi:SAM-dependent methyltransferase
MAYYDNKIHILRDIFGCDVIVEGQFVLVGNNQYPVVDDVIVLLEPSQYTDKIHSCLKSDTEREATPEQFSRSVQTSFGGQWEKYDEILPEHMTEFHQYFDIINIEELKNSRVCDLGCGIGRWGYFLRHRCREIIFVDFSDAIFVARKNLRDVDNAIFFMGDIKRLPFQNNFCDFLFCLGVLHHMPTDALDEVRALAKYARQNLIYLYYALDNRPVHFKIMYYGMEFTRRWVSEVKSEILQQTIVWCITLLVYLPLICLGYLLRPLSLSKYVPLFDYYHSKSIIRIRQDVHDRFCTAIEHRYSKNQIMKLKDTYSKVIISDQLPYWHFRCIR